MKTLDLKKSLSSFFPESSIPRPQQAEALEKIQTHFNSDKKYVIACLPTGSGKSHIGLTVGNSTRQIDHRLKNLINDYSVYKKNKNGEYIHENDFLNADPFGAYILTITKSLQDQYQNLFDYVPTIKGKNNYQCDVDSAYSAENAPCLFSKKIKQSCFDSDRCPYYKARNNALSSQSPILNYRVFFNLPNFLRRREIYICDEASGFEDELVSKYTFELKYSQIDNEEIKYKKLLTDDSKTVLIWLQDIYIQLENRVDNVKNVLNDMDSNDKAYFKNMQKLSKLNKIYNSLKETLDYWDSSSYLVEKRDSESVVVCPYNIKPIASDIFAGANKILMMSATLSNHKEFAKSLGINDYEYFESESTFDSKKSPILCSRKFKLSYKTMEQNLPHVLDAAIKLCEKHPNEKGVIHTHTNFITNKLQNKIKNNKRFLFRDISTTNDNLLDLHKNTKEPTILVSPSLDTGISLDDDLGRFQIILKSPYLPLSSKRIKKMMDANPSHYTMKMLNKLIQMCGRCTRSFDDYSVTYVLDGIIVDTIMREKNNIPKHFLDRLV